MTELASTACRRFESDVSSLDDITSRKMFGGFGVFHRGKMFAMVTSEGKVCLKAAPGQVPAFLKAGLEQNGRMPYWFLPETIRANPEQLLEWVGGALAAAHGAT